MGLQWNKGTPTNNGGLLLLYGQYELSIGGRKIYAIGQYENDALVMDWSEYPPDNPAPLPNPPHDPKPIPNRFIVSHWIELTPP